MTRQLNLLALLAPLALAGCCGLRGSLPPRVHPLDPEAPIQVIPVAPGAAWIPPAVGERWVYAATWNGIPVGTAVLEATDLRMVRGRKALHMACTVQLSAYIRAFYHLQDEVATDIDVETGLPLQFTKHIEEGKRLKDEFIAFDHAGKVATYYRQETGEGETSFTPLLAMDIPDGVQDPLSSLFRARALKLLDGQEETIQVNTDEKTYATRLKALGRERLTLEAFGTVSAIRIDPSLDYEGVLPSKGRMQLWVEEETRIPLKMVLEIKIGSVSAELIGREGAAAPFKPAPPEAAPIPPSKP